MQARADASFVLTVTDSAGPGAVKEASQAEGVRGGCNSPGGSPSSAALLLAAAMYFALSRRAAAKAKAIPVFKP